MKRYIINGGKKLSGEVKISGSKNVVTKAVIAACLTQDPVTLTNIPSISDLESLLEVIASLGGDVKLGEDEITITVENIKDSHVSLAAGAKVRTSSMFLAPLLARTKKAVVPNPEGCRIGARPIEWHIEGLTQMGADIKYNSGDGYYYATTQGLKGTTYTFKKNTHTGTETLILAAVLASGTTILENAAEEHEIDDLIALLTEMGAKITREPGRRIIIEGVESLHGTTHRIIPDANEFVTFAVLSLISGGNIYLTNTDPKNVDYFLEEVKKVGGDWEEDARGMRFFLKDGLDPSDITTAMEPGFKTDWQGPWAVLMTQANGNSTIHETIYENRFGYVSELKKMGAKIEYFNPEVDNPQDLYNFNFDLNTTYQQAIQITGPIELHNAVLSITDLRAGATLVIASLIAQGQSIINGVEHIDRGYEDFETRLIALGADIQIQNET